jgi:magnesium transporter
MLVNCVSYKQGLRQKDLALHEITETLKNPETIVWVALKDPTQEEISIIRETFQLHPLAIEDIFHEWKSTKIEEYGETLFAVLNSPELQEKKVHFGQVYLFVGPQFIVSIRNKLEKGFVNIRERCEQESHLLAMGSGFVFYTIIDTIVDRYFPIVDKLEQEFEVLEDSIFHTNTSQKHIQSIYILKQKLIQIRHTINPLIVAVGRLHGGRVPKVCISTQDYFRDVNDHLIRLEVSVENIREMLLTAIQVNLTLISLRESEVNKKLAAWAALIGFPTMLAGIYGMNFKYMPELEWPWSYPIVIALMFGIDIYLYFRFKKSGWV